MNFFRFFAFRHIWWALCMLERYDSETKEHGKHEDDKSFPLNFPLTQQL